jgi:predicted molibdopterin-dependent oxidoreductase YjgC
MPQYPFYTLFQEVCMSCDETRDVVGISPVDAESNGIQDGEMILLISRSGEVVVQACISEQVPRGQLWMEEFPFAKEERSAGNSMECPAAEHKSCAIRIEKLHKDPKHSFFYQGDGRLH